MKKVKTLLYCTKAKPYLVKDDFPLENELIYFTHYKEPGSCGLPLNGKIVAECEVETEEIKLSAYSDYEDKIYLFDTPTLTNDELTEKSWLCNDELDNYLINEKGYALHISNLSIFAEPATIEYADLKSPVLDSELIGGSWLCDNCDTPGNDCKHCHDHYEFFKTVEKAPQNMMKVYSNIGRYDCQYILISVRPEWLCKILNGEKTIEVRKKVLKEML